MKITLWIYWCTLLEKVELSTYERDLSGSIWTHSIFLRTEEVEIAPVEKPSDDFLRGKMVANLQNQKSAIQADAHMKVKAIDEQIQQLLCIENLEPA